MLLVVARIGRPHGVNGEATIEVRTDSPEERFAIGSVLQTEPKHFGPLTVESLRDHNGTLLLKFREAQDRTAVEKLRNILLYADVDIDEQSQEDEFHLQQLLSCQAYFENGDLVGPVVDVVKLPSQDLLAIEFEGREVLVPFVKELVPTVNISERRVIIANKEGLFDA